MKTEIENMNWIIEGIRDSLEKIKEAEGEVKAEVAKMATTQGDKSWE